MRLFGFKKNNNKEINAKNIYDALTLLNNIGSQPWTDVRKALDDSGFGWSMHDAFEYNETNKLGKPNYYDGLKAGNFGTGASVVANCYSDARSFAFMQENFLTRYDGKDSKVDEWLKIAGDKLDKNANRVTPAVPEGADNFEKSEELGE